MDVTITQESPILIRAEVNVPWETVVPHYDSAIRDLRQAASIPGFRKGKAPAAILKKRFRKEIVDDLSRKVIPEHMQTWIKEKAANAVGQPRIHHVHLKDGDHFHYAVLLEVIPEVELQDWKGIEVESLNVTVEEDAIDHALDQKLKEATKRISITDRPAEAGDRVVVALTVIDKNAGETVSDFEKFVVFTEGEKAHPQLSQWVLGLALEETKELVFSGAEDDPTFEDWRGKELKAFLEVGEIFRVNEPELNDAFAKEEGFDSLDALRDQVRQDLAEKLEEAEREKTRMRVINKLIEPYDFQPPQSLVQEEAQSLVQQQIMPFANQLGSQGLSRDLIQSMMQYALPQATSKIRVDILLDKIALDAALEISEEELTEELEKNLEQFQVSSVTELREKYGEETIQQSVVSFMKRRKALDAIMEAATINKVDRLSEEAAAEEEEPSGEAEPADQVEANAASTETE